MMLHASGVQVIHSSMELRTISEDPTSPILCPGAPSIAVLPARAPKVHLQDFGLFGAEGWYPPGPLRGY